MQQEKWTLYDLR